MCRNDQHCKIIKYADDTVIIGLVDNDDESKYTDCIEYVSTWCNKNFLNLNVSKTKEMIIDFRRKSTNVISPVQIDNKDVEIVSSYKYLGCTLQNNLRWSEHICHQVKKANKRMYHVRCLAKLRVDNNLICMFYNSIVSSVLSYAIICWFNSLTGKEQKSVEKLKRKVCKLIKKECHHLIFDMEQVYKKQCMSSLTRILDDCTHPLNAMFNFLPSGERLNVSYYNTNRAKNTFVPSAIKLFNS